MSDEQDKIRKSDEEWRKSLTDVQFTVCRLGGTEPAFSGEYWDTKAPGIYACAACGQDLFDSDSKYDSGTGWPSFFQPIDKDRVIERRDTSHGMIRTEILCARCDSHLGHLFPDGPEPTGLRFCMNSAALDLKPRDGD